MAIKRGIYRHFKGHLFHVLEVGKHTDSQEEYVVYKALYGDDNVWVRPIERFTETIINKGKQVKRFELV